MAHYGPISAWSSYLAARLGACALTAFDARANLRSAAMIGRGFYALDAKHRKRAMHNVALAYPDWDQRRVRDTVVASCEHFVQLAVETLYTPRLMGFDSWLDRTEVSNLGEALAIMGSGRPCILVTGHLGNWEVLGYLLAVLGHDLDAIARPLDNKLINDWLMGIRTARGLRIITKFDATDRMLEVLDSGGALGFIADQNAGDKGIFVPFQGRLASTYKSIGLLALRHEVPILCGYAHRLRGPHGGYDYRFELGCADVIHPEDWADQKDPLYYITARYCRAIETMVTMRPEQYLWMHRRWKSRPRHEKLGKPIPDGLRKQLESLPWMTGDLMRRLEVPPGPPPA